MTPPELQACLHRLGVRLSLRLVVDAPAGVMTPDLKAALAAHKPALLATLARADDRTDPARPPVSEPPGPVGSDGPGPAPADRSWRAAVARWPIEWRERWGRRANELQDAGDAWDVAEWRAFQEVVPKLVEAERREEVWCPDPPAGD